MPSVQEQVSALFEQEEMSGPNRVLCPRCGEHQDATKTCALSKHTTYVAVHVPRVSSVDGQEHKVEDHAQFCETLNLPTTDGPTDAATAYELRAVVVHTGQPQNGAPSPSARLMLSGTSQIAPAMVLTCARTPHKQDIITVWCALAVTSGSK